MNQSIRNALDDLETAADKVESNFESDMINESVQTIREELDGIDELPRRTRGETRMSEHTTYTIHDSNGPRMKTDSPNVAEAHSRIGLAVTAVTEKQ